jgi:hypothetical protein
MIERGNFEPLSPKKNLILKILIRRPQKKDSDLNKFVFLPTTIYITLIVCPNFVPLRFSGGRENG